MTLSWQTIALVANESVSHITLSCVLSGFLCASLDSLGGAFNGGRGRVWSASSRPDQRIEEKEVPSPAAEALDKELEELASKMDSLWKGRADCSEWDEVKADLEVYRLSGETVLEDPCRKETYRQAVLEGLGFGDDAAERRPGMSSDDLAACKEVLGRKAAGFWLEDPYPVVAINGGGTSRKCNLIFGWGGGGEINVSYVLEVPKPLNI